MRNGYITEEEIISAKEILEMNDNIYQIIDDIELNKNFDLLQNIIDTINITKPPSLNRSERHEYNFTKLELMTILYINSNGEIKEGFEYFGGVVNLIRKATLAYWDNSKKFNLLKEKMKQDAVLFNKSSLKSLSVRYKFISEYFIIDIDEAYFTDINNSSSINLKQRDKRLSKKDMTKPMIGALFTFINEGHEFLGQRLLFKYIKKGRTEIIDFVEAVRILKKEEAKERQESLNIFVDNLSKSFNTFIAEETKRTF